MQWIFGLFFVASFVLGIWWQTRRNRDLRPLAAPRQMEQQGRRNAVITSLMFTVILGGSLVAYGKPPDVLWLRNNAVILICLPLVLLGARPRRKPQDYLLNYAYDPGHCGRCGYDLTGNVTGRCPECGWTIPDEVPVVDDPAWALWWREWRIRSLQRWPKTLAFCVVYAVLFAALAAFFWWTTGHGVAVPVPLLMAVHMVINAVRVVQYGQRVKKAQAPPAGTGEA